MTNREFFTAVMAIADEDSEVYTFAKDGIAKLDKRNSDRSSKPSKTAVANEPIKEAILNFIADHIRPTSPIIAEAVGITTQKASALCRQLVEDGKLTVCDVKVPKKGTLKCYSLAEVAGDEEPDEE